MKLMIRMEGNKMLAFTYDKLTKEQTEAYLARIGYSGEIRINKECLDHLIYAHQCMVPFENLTPCYYHEPVRLEIPVLYQKVVEEQRGGYCFELNGIFLSLLYSLGFPVYSVMVRLFREPGVLRPVMHRGCIARLDGKYYFFDVGYGGPMAPFAVELSEKRQTFFGETYWVETFEDNVFCLFRKRSIPGYNYDGTAPSDADKNQMIAAFSLAPMLNEDFIPLNRMTSIENPESNFVKRLFVNLRTSDGYLSLMDHTFTEFHRGSGKEVRTLSDEEILEILESKYGLKVRE